MAGARSSKLLSNHFHSPADAIVLALGGASRPETGSDGTWPAILAAHGVEIAPWVPANCGWEVDWPPELLARAEGLPLKNLTVRAGDESVSGELLITRHGLEGGAIYRLGRTLRSMREPRLEIDFKPQLTAEALRERAAALPGPSDWFRAWKLSAGAIALLETISPHDCHDRELAIRRVKNFSLALRAPRPIAEAISSAGGVRWSELDRKPDAAQAPRNLRGRRNDRLGSAYRRLSPARLLCHGHAGRKGCGSLAQGIECTALDVKQVAPTAFGTNFGDCPRRPRRKDQRVSVSGKRSKG